jgi:hypothetical protein
VLLRGAATRIRVRVALGGAGVRWVERRVHGKLLIGGALGTAEWRPRSSSIDGRDSTHDLAPVDRDGQFRRQRSENMKTLRAVLSTVAVAGSLALAPQTAHADADAKRDKQIENKFKSADKDHDGKLTFPEAKAGMPRVAKAFDKIDKDKRGYVTVDEIKTFAATMNAH